MKKLTTHELKKLWLEFWTSKGYKTIPSASVVPENDATVLFTTAGMHPLVPYLLGEKHPMGDKLCDYQACIRTNDIEEVGDSSHCTFFEMLGNWTLGECDKHEMIKNSFAFLTEKLGIPKNKLAVSVFAGDENAPRDVEAHDAWVEAGLDDSQIFYLPKENNWWALGGGTGPCGPDTEMFFDTGKPKCCDSCSPACDCGKYLEIWNDVFMQYYVKDVGQPVEKLARPNIDTGMGIERTVCVLNGVESVYDTGIFKDVIDFLSQFASAPYVEENVKKSYRVICDHIRASVFILSSGITPAPVGQGYVLRRLIRRSVNHARKIGIEKQQILEVAKIYIQEYQEYYPEIKEKQDVILKELDEEIEKFSKTIQLGQKEFEKVAFYSKDKTINGKTAFRLYDTFGFPLELTVEMAKEIGYNVDEEGYHKAFVEHQEKSRTAAAGAFKGGLSDTSDNTARLHTATHLLLAGLQTLFDPNIIQKGSNITPERLRFDFNFPRKMLPEELKMLEDFVNDAIKKEIDVVCEEMSLDQARACGAKGIFANKYGEKVKVYTIGNVSKEICGGPHANNTRELKSFKIIKEESSSSGVRRIKAVIG
ncbi:MAG: alanine--tRNA ligase [Christensenellales bacterium]